MYSNKELFEYPIDEDIILRKKRKLKRMLLEKKGELLNIKIAILGGSTTSEIKEILELFLINKGINPIFYESGYNKYFEDIVFNQELKSFEPDVIYIHTTIKNLKYMPKINDDDQEVQKNLSLEYKHFKILWDKIKSDFKAIIIQNNFELPKNRSLGNLDGVLTFGVTKYINQLNMKFNEYAANNKSIFINDINYLSARVGLDKWYDNKLWYSYKYAISFEAIPHLAQNLANIICGIYGKSKKCLVLDLDNTLWGGVIGDDGVEHIELGLETAIGEAYLQFQKYIGELKDRGITLAISSKNERDVVSSGLKHPEMYLKEAEFTSIKANWEPKYLNIKQIAKEINIGIDSLVFIDDNPVERASVKEQLPQVEVPNIQDEVIDYIDYIDRNGYFESVGISQDDLKRKEYYESNRNREEECTKFTSYEDFLASLEMISEIEFFKPVYLERIAQLTNKTNQFNLTTKRYTLQEIKEIYNNNNVLKIYGRLKDKFGDNGLISVVIGEIKGNDLHVSLWIMSCRVLKRGMELAMFDKIVEFCRQKNVKRIYGYYYKTSKNKMVEGHYQSLGFTLLEKSDASSKWVINVEDIQSKKNKYIKVGAY